MRVPFFKFAYFAVATILLLIFIISSATSTTPGISDELCNDDWIKFNYSGFKEVLATEVYGQPLVGLANSVHHHWRDSQSSKALVLSLHGPTGTGKNFVSRILANHLYKQGTHSKFYHLLSVTSHFIHASLKDTYKDQLQSWVRGNISRCPRTMFVFDEFDKMQHSLELLDTLKPFLDYYDNIDGVDYRRAIFVFLCNSGSELIMNRMVEQKRQGLKRYDVYNEFDNSLPKYLKSTKEGPGSLLYHNLVSRFIPLLPLERNHVAGCIDAYLQTIEADRPIPSCFIDQVLSKIEFVPEEDQFFAESGCKRVIDITQKILELQQNDRNRSRKERLKERDEYA